MKIVFQATLFGWGGAFRWVLCKGKQKLKRDKSLWKIREGKSLLYAPFSQSTYFWKIVLVSTLSSLWSGYKSLGKLDQPPVSSVIWEGLSEGPESLLFGRQTLRWHPCSPVSAGRWEAHLPGALFGLQGYPHHKGMRSVLPVDKAGKQPPMVTLSSHCDKRCCQGRYWRPHHSLCRSPGLYLLGSVRRWDCCLPHLPRLPVMCITSWRNVYSVTKTLFLYYLSGDKPEVGEGFVFNYISPTLAQVGH